MIQVAKHSKIMQDWERVGFWMFEYRLKRLGSIMFLHVVDLHYDKYDVTFMSIYIYRNIPRIFRGCSASHGVPYVLTPDTDRIDQNRPSLTVFVMVADNPSICRSIIST